MIIIGIIILQVCATFTSVRSLHRIGKKKKSLILYYIFREIYYLYLSFRFIINHRVRKYYAVILFNLFHTADVFASTIFHTDTLKTFFVCTLH